MSAGYVLAWTFTVASIAVAVIGQDPLFALLLAVLALLAYVLVAPGEAARDAYRRNHQAHKGGRSWRP